MHIFRPENIEPSRRILKCNTVSDFRPDHHETTLHIIVHDIFQLRHQRLLINQVKINFILLANLNPDISLSIIS
jgi:hypothetical protein